LPQVSAVKVLRIARDGPSQLDVDYELRNARKIKAWKHQHIVQIFSVCGDVAWRDGGLASFIQMEKCQTDLKQWIFDLHRENGTMELKEYYRILSDILKGLEFLHAKKIIHRDIKAGNSIFLLCLVKLIAVLRRRDGTWVLGDFGISVERLSGKLRPSTRGRASLETCAPEMMKPGKFHDHRLDVWAVGCVAHLLATGRQLFYSVHDFAQLAGLFVNLSQDQVPTISKDGNLLVRLDSPYSTENFNPDKVFTPILTPALQVDLRSRATAGELLALTRSLLLPLEQGLTWPRKLPTASNFVGRRATLKRIHNSFKDHSTILLHGLPGVGKTSIAAEYVLLHRDEYRRVAYLQHPFEQDFLECMFELLTERSKGDPYALPRCTPSIAPWLWLYDGGLIVLDLGHQVSSREPIRSLINALVARTRTEARVLFVSCQTQLHGCVAEEKVIRIKVPDLAVVTATEYARWVKGSQWRVPMSFSSITYYGYSRPSIFKYILESCNNFSEILVETRRFKQHAVLGLPFRGPSLDDVLGHPSFWQVFSGIGPNCAVKILILSFLNHYHITKDLAETLLENWVPDSASSDADKLSVGLLTPEDLRRWESSSIIEWHTSSKIAFSLDPYIQSAILYEYCSNRVKLGRELWENTRQGLEIFGNTLEREDFEVNLAAHLGQISESRPSLFEGCLKFVPEYTFPNLWEVYKDTHRFVLTEQETARKPRGAQS
jgi:serine/threonine protein kinase